ncbi:IS3 family transposase [Corynebacterium sp. ACRPH]|uniref:IS3 family transposase n=1 Tax=Corynebacterium sp. ACRPH TaxID=2918199 RepID=UPI001EF2EC76|nr:IS3 family transposase [Corynebacterium sp. ACRPH]MCG7457131.1 IS3 family transposase [Corynebacterium sp. ACRPH]
MSIGIVSQSSSSARCSTRIAKAVFLARVDTANPRPGALSARALRDAALVEHIRDVHAENYCVYGVRKMWRVPRRHSIDIGREHTARLMRTEALPLQALN